MGKKPISINIYKQISSLDAYSILRTTKKEWKIFFPRFYKWSYKWKKKIMELFPIQTKISLTTLTIKKKHIEINV